MWQSEWSIEAILTNIGPKYIQMYCRCIYHTWNTWASYGQRLDDKGLLSLIRCGLFQLHGCLFLDCWFGIQEFHYNEDNHKLGFSMECKPPTYTICQPYFNQRRVFLMFTISKRLQHKQCGSNIHVLYVLMRYHASQITINFREIESPLNPH